MPKVQRNGTFYASNIASIAAGATDATNSDDIQIPPDVDRIFVQGFCAIAAGEATKDAVFLLVKSVDGTNFADDNNATVYRVNLSATTVIGGAIPIDVEGIKKIRVTSVENEAAGNPITAVNLRYSYLTEALAG